MFMFSIMESYSQKTFSAAMTILNIWFFISSWCLLNEVLLLYYYYYCIKGATLVPAFIQILFYFLFIFKYLEPHQVEVLFSF